MKAASGEEGLGTKDSKRIDLKRVYILTRTGTGLAGRKAAAIGIYF